VWMGPAGKGGCTRGGGGGGPGPIGLGLALAVPPVVAASIR
jgi:hypothetical protein